MFALRRSSVASWPAIGLFSAHLLALVGCAKSPCSGQSCAETAVPNESRPTSPAVDAMADAATSQATSSAAETTSVACRIDEDCTEQTPVCSDNGQCVACSNNEDCGDPARPYCKVAKDETRNRCVACQKGTDCGGDGSWLCVEEQCFEACDPLAAEDCAGGLVCVSNATQQAMYCAQCGEGVPCANPDLLCVGNTCLTCDPKDNQGCRVGEFCQEVTTTVPAGEDAGLTASALAATRCVACRSDVPEDCPGGACVDGQCQTCQPETNTGCGEDTPICVVESDAGVAAQVCVQCTAPDDCAGHPAGSHCVDNRCAGCDPEDAESCAGGSSDTCVNVAPAGATPLFECRECETEQDCTGSLVCVDFECVPCGRREDCGTPALPRCSANECVACSEDVDCERFEDTPVCQAGECVACKEDAHCESRLGTPACSSKNECVECTNSTHCPNSPGGCLTFPGADQYTCTEEEPGSDALELCSLCNPSECAEGLICAGPEGHERCLEPVQPDDTCVVKEFYSEEAGGLVSVCTDESCDP